MDKFLSYRILHQMSKSEKHIPILTLPEDTQHNMKFIGEKGIEYLRSMNFEVDKRDTITLNNLSRQEKSILTFVDWYTRSNDIICSLNIILDDLSLFCESPYLFHGQIDARLQLFIRTFFNEFYRSRDSWNRFLRDSERLGIISKEDMKDAKKNFKRLYGEAIEIRNNLLHAFTPSGSTRDNLETMLIQSAIDRGMYLADKTSKEVIVIENVLNDYLIKNLPVLINIGVTLRNDIQERVNIFNLAFTDANSTS